MSQPTTTTPTLREIVNRPLPEIVRRDRPHFDGPVYEPRLDHARLTGQILRVYEAVSDGEWRTLDEIQEITGDPHASISAQLRHLRKQRFGSYVIHKRRRGESERGLWEYRLAGQSQRP